MLSWLDRDWLMPIAVTALVLYVTFMVSASVILTMRRRRLAPDADALIAESSFDVSPVGHEDRPAPHEAG